MAVSLDSTVLDQLNTDEARALHDISDNLSACGVGKLVNLPQIIVVGDQSSGKSSVLEAISHVHFPVEGGLCTRFATELVLRHAKQTRADVSVKFADSSKPSHSFQRVGFSEEDLPEIIAEAKECMGFSRSDQGFSKDVLRLEIQGPGMYPLTLVDLPGLFHTETETQTLQGKDTVEQLVESYMRRPNSIILVVVAANTSLANNAALSKVKCFDPNRERTLGVITKPDLPIPGYADETTYVRVASNRETANKLKLGWHVLRNRAENEPSLDARDDIEERFFQKGAWTSIPKQDLGIANFRKKLSRVMYDHLRTSLPGVVEDIESKLESSQEELDRLGKSRSTPEDMRSFLLGIAGDFQRLSRDAVYGRYNDPFFGSLDDEDRKLRAQLRNFSRVFDHVLRTRGCEQTIVRGSDDFVFDTDVDLPEYLTRFLDRYPYDFQKPPQISGQELESQLQRQASANQGREFPGSPNQELAIQLFQKQASPWRRIAEFHIERVTLIAKIFVDSLFEHIVGSPMTNRTAEKILTTCVDPFFRQKEILLKGKLQELIQPYTQGYALPLDADLHYTLNEKSMTRIAHRICGSIKDKYPSLFANDGQGKVNLTRDMLVDCAVDEEYLDDDEFGTDKVVDMMLAYYDISRRTFTDNVVNLAIESCLVRDIPEILTPTKIGSMDDERLAELAGESEETQTRRESLEREVAVLRKGLERCRLYKPRAVTGKNMLQMAIPRTRDRVLTATSMSSSPSISVGFLRPTSATSWVKFEIRPFCIGFQVCSSR
ncbi:hypothetical protein ACO1O0_009184 [Amphichorda felina]